MQRGKAGDVIELHCFEVLDAKGNVYLDNLRGAKEAMKYTFAREEETAMRHHLPLWASSMQR